MAALAAWPLCYSGMAAVIFSGGSTALKRHGRGLGSVARIILFIYQSEGVSAVPERRIKFLGALAGGGGRGASSPNRVLVCLFVCLFVP